MRISIASVIRSFSQVVAYSEDTDTIYQKILKKDAEKRAGEPSVFDLLTSRISGWTAQREADMISTGKKVIKYLKDGDFDQAGNLYKDKIIPWNKKHLGRI